MDIHFGDIFGPSIKLYALMTPPAVLSAFLSHTKTCSEIAKRKIALKTSLAIFIPGLILFVWGADIFELSGFTLDAFRIGTGVLLMLAEISLMNDKPELERPEIEGDISVVPLAIPLGMGPASIGAVMVMGASATTSREFWTGILSLFIAAFCMFLLLLPGDIVARLLRKTGIQVLAKLTGLILAAISAQVIFTGVINFMH